MTTKTKTAPAALPTRSEVEPYADRAADYLRAWLKANAPAEVFDLWEAHTGLMQYECYPPADIPELAETFAHQAALDVETVLRVAGPLPQPSPADMLLTELVSAWKHLAGEDKDHIAAMFAKFTGKPVCLPAMA